MGRWKWWAIRPTPSSPTCNGGVSGPTVMVYGNEVGYEKRAMRHARNIIYIVLDVDDTQHHGNDVHRRTNATGAGIRKELLSDFVSILWPV